MRRLFVLLTFILFFFAITTSASFAQSTDQQYATCDACGFCKVTQQESSQTYTVKDGYIVPGNWEACRQCLYPNATNANQPETKETVTIDATTGRAPTPQPGRFYTMVGCISTNLGSFQQSGAAASVVQTMLTMLFSVAGGVTFLYLIYGAFVLITSQNDPERLNLGRRIMVGSIMGLLISLFAVFIVNFLATNILQLPWFKTQ